MMLKISTSLCLVAVFATTFPASAQMSQKTQVRGKTEINVATEGATAIATGENNVARNRIGVIKGDKQGDTKISVKTGTVTTIVSGRNRKACTNIGGVVSDECK